MRTILGLMLAFVGMTAPGTADDNAPKGKLGSTVQLQLAADDVVIDYVESEEGMVLVLSRKFVSLQAQRFYIGDGKVAMLYEASNKGFTGPNVNPKSANHRFTDGETIKVKAKDVSKWAAHRGEVYVHLKGLTIEVQKD